MTILKYKYDNKGIWSYHVKGFADEKEATVWADKNDNVEKIELFTMGGMKDEM